jgi:hypothetical protein
VDEQPVWRRLFDAWEKENGPRLEEYVQSDEFAERIAAFQQMTRRQAEMAEEATRQFLRFWNLPTASDLDKVNQQLAEIDRRLRELHRPVYQQAPAPGPRKRQGSKTAAGMRAAVESREAAAKGAEAVVDAGPGDRPGEASSVAQVDPAPADGAGPADGVTAKASVTKAKASKAKPSTARASTGKGRNATPAKASGSPKSSAPAQKAPQKAASRSRSSGYRGRGSERDAGQNPTGEA